ncbi:MAG: thioredoxin domain-containing protein [Candidatus Paceibacterota bacterium]
MKPSIIWSIVVIILLVAVFSVVKMAKAPVTSGVSGSIPEISAGDQTRGPKDSKVVVVEYSDFQCPACAAFFPAVDDLNKELDGKILFVYRNFPLPQHQNAELAAEAAGAAGLQGKFWEMHDALFENQAEWSESGNAKDFFIRYAGTAGINIEQFNRDISSREVKNKIEDDLSGGFKANINSTPTFFLNGKKMEGFNSYDEFKNLVREAVRNNS